jgi:hypothetical protein
MQNQSPLDQASPQASAPLVQEPQPLVQPPPPPALDPRPTPLQYRILLTLFGAGLVAFVSGLLMSTREAMLVQRGGVFFAVYALVVAASWLPPSVLSRRIDATLDKWVRGSATGYYGMMALATFVHLEIGSLFDAVTGFEFSVAAVRDAAVQWLIGFSQESIMNLVWGFAWPGNLFQARADAMLPGILVGITLLIFRACGRLLPHANFQGPKKYKKKKKKKGQTEHS